MVQATDDPPSARDFVDKVKDLVAEVFPDSHIGSISRTQPFVCSGCRRESEEGVLVELVEEFSYCRECWRDRSLQPVAKVSELPASKKKPGKKKKQSTTTGEQLDLLGDQDWD